MRRRWLAALCLVALCAVTRPAHAKTLIATALFDAPTDEQCVVTNAGTKPIQATVEIVSSFAVVLFTSSLPTVPPNSSSSGGTSHAGLVFCRVTGKFSRKTVRVTGVAFNGVTLTGTTPGF
jgi:hypothetical protein